MRRPGSRRFSAALALLVLTGAAALAQQKYRLKDIDLAGDFSSVESELVMALDVEARAGGQTLPVMKFANSELEKYTEEVLSVDKEGASGLRRVYSVARSEETDPTGARKEQVSSRQGNTVAIRRQGGKVVVTSTPGKLGEEDRKSLLDDLENTDAAFFPDQDVAPGDEWTVERKVAAKIFKGVEAADIKCRFSEVTEYSGRPCARLEITLDLAGQPEGMPGRMAMKLKGSAYYALDLERPVALDLAGPVTMKGEAKENGVTITFDGTGRFQAKETRQWVKIGGKALPTAK